MLHDISPDALRVGMFISSLNQDWLSVPFWRRRFLVTDERLRARVLESGVSKITIDDALGVGLGAITSGIASPATSEPQPELRTERRCRPRSAKSLDECDRARQILARSKAAIIDMFAEARLGHAVDIGALEPLVEEIAASVARDQYAMISVTRLKTKNEYTYLHSVAVCALMMNFARQLNWPAEAVRQAGMAGMLHDIGKMAIPGSLLDKAGSLDDGERKMVQSHPEHGHALLSRSGDVGNVVLDVCLHHHERVDGRGYPHGLTGSELSEVARMGAICDVYDAVTSDRPYKRAWSPGEALARMLSWDGHFDARLLRAFITSLGIFPIGGLVRLRSNRLAIVMREHPDNATTPFVRAFHAAEGGRAVPIEDVATDATGDPVIRGESGPRWFGTEWTDLLGRVAKAAVGDHVEPGDIFAQSAAL